MKHYAKPKSTLNKYCKVLTKSDLYKLFNFRIFCDFFVELRKFWFHLARHVADCAWLTI
jgi:hypothetical protein